MKHIFSALPGGLALLLIQAGATSPRLWAQDYGGALFFAQPQALSPSFAGLKQSLVSVTAGHLFRNFSSNTETRYLPIASMSRSNLTTLSVDVPIWTRVFKGGAGVYVANDLTAGLRSTETLFALSYDVPLSYKARYDHLRAGFQAGFVQRAVEQQSLFFEDQFTGRGFWGASGDLNALSNLTQIHADVSLGLMWYRTQKVPGNPEFLPFVGGAIQHVNRPKVGFFSPQATTMRYTAYAGMKQLTRGPLDFNAAALVFVQNRSRLFGLGAQMRYVFYENNDPLSKELAALMFGVNARITETVSPFVGMQYKKALVFGASVDVYTGHERVNTAMAGFHVMAAYHFGAEKYKGQLLPFAAF
ncbi:MAG: type IX secretion system membrane protein PorP/SprF [Bacteroidia bacterium]|nr:type IX secretion system membrane protein PorP/SprF [Bacteroidia bacterium]